MLFAVKERLENLNYNLDFGEGVGSGGEGPFCRSASTLLSSIVPLDLGLKNFSNLTT